MTKYEFSKLRKFDLVVIRDTLGAFRVARYMGSAHQDWLYNKGTISVSLQYVDTGKIVRKHVRKIRRKADDDRRDRIDMGREYTDQIKHDDGGMF